MDPPCSNGVMRRKRRSPRMLRRMPWSARKVAAVKAPLMVTAVACAKRWRARLGSPATDGKNERAEDAGSDEDEGEEDGERKDSGKEEAAGGDGQEGEDEDVEKIGEQEVPLIYSGRAHDEEGVHDVEVVVGRPATRTDAAMARAGRRGRRET